MAKKKTNRQDESRDMLLAAAKDDIERAFSYIMGMYKFFGEFVYRFRVLYTYHVSTMATDGKNFFINPKFVAELNDREIVYVLCHEILHNVLDHWSRAKQKGLDESIPSVHDKWNRAGDYEINLLLCTEVGSDKKTPLLTVDEVKNMGPGGKWGGCIDTKWVDVPAEIIYDSLPDNPPNKGKMEYPAQVGDYIKIKSGKYGVIDSINADGSYEIKEITKEELDKAFGI